MADNTPNKGKDWLRLKLSEGANRLWQEPTRTTFGFRAPNGRLIDTRNPDAMHAERERERAATDGSEARARLKTSDAIAMLSVRVVARDWNRKGREVETWLRCALIRRMIERDKPTRDGVGHDRYQILIAFLVANGIATTDGKNGYAWTTDYKTLNRRAEWLVELTHRAGEMHHMKAAHRYSITFDG